MPKRHDTDDLWAIHIEGPDDVIAAPSCESAHAAADYLLDRMQTAAEAIPWPYGAESHAHSLAREWPEYARLVDGASNANT